jgi:hypothetical protein
MGIRCEGTAKLKILETDEVFEVNPDDLEWELVDADERPMGAELYYSAAFYFYSEQEGFEVKVEWDAWEYPIGTIECVNVECDGCELLEDFYIDSDSLEEIELTFPESVSPGSIADGFSELRIKIQDEYGSELSLKEYKLLDDGSRRITVAYPSRISDADRIIKEPLEKRIRELENQLAHTKKQLAHTKGKLESQDSEKTRLERLLATPKVQINNSVNLQIGSNNNMGDNRTVNTGGGNYYESIDTSGGDYVQGNYINMSQDLTQAASHIQDLIEQLQKNGVSVDVAQEQVAKDVAAQAQKNPTVRDKLVKWGQSLGDATVSDVVKGVVKLGIRSAGIPLP